MSLHENETNTVYSFFANCQTYCAAIVKLYRAYPDPTKWSGTGIVGAAVIVEDGGCNYIRVLDLKQSRVVFEQEFYQQFDYKVATPTFHTFETNDYVVGLSFADQGEAETFAQNAHEGISYQNQQEQSSPAPSFVYTPKPAGGATPAPQPVVPSSPPPVLSQSPSQPSFPAAPAPSTAPTVSTAPMRSQSVSGPSGGGGFSTPTTGLSGESTEIAGLSMKVIKLNNPLIGKEDEKKKDKKSSWNIFGKKEPRKPQVSAPTDFKQESHIGWDPVNGFEIKNIPPEWKKLFQAAGVKKSDLKDVETSKLLVNTVAEAMTAPPAPPPPPPPPSGVKAPPPPGPPPSGPPPPGPPPPSLSLRSASISAGSGSSGGLLDQIREGRSLKKVDAAAPSALPDIKNLDNATQDNIVATLSLVMSNRRAAVLNEDDDSDNDADDWSD